jgi:hypothetical protein
MEDFMVQAIKDLGSARWRGLALLVAAATVLLAGCSQLDDASFGFWDLLWGMVIFFFWFMAIWIFISLFADIFRRDDLSGGMKAVWILALFILPFLGALIYIVSRPKATPQDVRMMAQAEAATKAVGGVSHLFYITSLTYDPKEEGRIAHDDKGIGYDWLKGPDIK